MLWLCGAPVVCGLCGLGMACGRLAMACGIWWAVSGGMRCAVRSVGVEIVRCVVCARWLVPFAILGVGFIGLYGLSCSVSWDNHGKLQTKT